MKFVISLILGLALACLGHSVEVRPLMPKPWPLNDPSFGKFFIGEKGTEILLPNQKRTTGAAMLKLSVEGATVVKHEPAEQVGTFAWELSDGNRMTFSVEATEDRRVLKHAIVLPGTKEDGKEVCVHYRHGDASWFNAFHSISPSWPMNTSTIQPKKDFANIRNYTNLNQFESHHLIMEQLFVSSSGFAIAFDQNQPLFIRRNPNQGDPILCFSANNSGPYDPKAKDPAYKDLKMFIFAGENSRVALDFVIQKSGLIPKPTEIPDEAKFRYPTFSAAAYDPNIPQVSRTKVLKLAADIEKNDFPLKSELLINDYLQREYGDIQLNPNQFAEPKKMMADLHQKGFRVGMGLTPIIKAYRQNMRHSDPTTEMFFVRDYRDNQATVLVDFSSKEASTWFEYLLHRAHYEYGIDTFELGATTPISWLLNFAGNQTQRHPGSITTKYVETGAKLGKGVVSDVAYKTQHLPNFVRLARDRYAYDWENELEAMVPNALAVSMAGYSWFVPYQIGGFYRENMPREELYIRWVQAATFMPSMSFLHTPWSYFNATVLNITRKFVNLHEQHAQTLIDLAKVRVATGSPIIRPLWYAAPEDPATYKISDQFLVGNEILVAPIMKWDQYERQVYLPEGLWDDQHGHQFVGKSWHTVKVPLDELAFFKRVTMPKNRPGTRNSGS